MNYVFVLLNMYLSKHCMLFTCGGNKEYYSSCPLILLLDKYCNQYDPDQTAFIQSDHGSHCLLVRMNVKCSIHSEQTADT